MITKRILAVEDEKDILDMYEFLFSDVGYEVSTSATGKDIQQQIAAFHPDLILLDVHLGELDGGDICRTIKNNPQTSGIAVLLVSAENNLRQIMSESGANACLSKPFDVNQLLKRMAQLLAA